MTPTAPMAYLLERMRGSKADPEQFDDSTIVRYLSDGYIAACESARLLRAWTQITLTASFQEYALPSDWCETLGVYQDGDAMEELPVRIAPRADPGRFYYTYDGVLGLVTTPTASGGSIILHYARRPAAVGIADTPESVFGPEWYHLMYHYAAWHVYRLGYGAQYIAEAARHRQAFDAGTKMLQRYASSRTEAATNSTPVTTVLSLPAVTVP